MTPTNRTDEATEAAKKAIWNWVCCNWCPTCSEKRTGKMVKEELVQAIASAIKSAVEAERARCAKVADEYAKYMEASIKKRKPQGLPTMVAECKLDAAKSIVSTIRQTPTKEGV